MARNRRRVEKQHRRNLRRHRRQEGHAGAVATSAVEDVHAGGLLSFRESGFERFDDVGRCALCAGAAGHSDAMPVCGFHGTLPLDDEALLAAFAIGLCQKFVHRNRLAVVASLLVAARLDGGIVSTAMQARRPGEGFSLRGASRNL